MKYIIAITLIVLAGCTPIQNIPYGYTGPKSKISDKYIELSATKMKVFELRKVNGRHVYATSSCATGQDRKMDRCRLNRDVPAEESVLLLKGLTHYLIPFESAFNKNIDVEGKVRVKLAPDESYKVNGVLSKEYSAVWLEDSQGNIVSNKIEKK